jgi:NCAIR mutase (PurE)-related protein
MDKNSLLQFLERFKKGEIGPDEAAERLNLLHLEQMKDFTLDHWRGLRTGFPEVIFGASKTPEQLRDGLERLAADNKTVLVTRLKDDAFSLLSGLNLPIHHNPRGRTLTVRKPTAFEGQVTVVTAGTGDIPVAEEAAETIEAMGVKAERVFDAGVAGLHRVLDKVTLFRSSDALVVIAGMEGALPSVVAGLVDIPVIAVPTSVGYGIHLNGIAPLMTMLNSCATGVSVVNIDNGFAAGYQAALIARRSGKK